MTTNNKPTTDTASEAGQLPEGWYVQGVQSTAHHAESLSGTDVRPVCSMAWTPASTTRPVRPGDSLCRSCVAELVEAAVDLNLPLLCCLGCQRLYPPNDRGVVSEHTIRKDGHSVVCPGSGILCARHDGNDTVRRAGLDGRTAVVAAMIDEREKFIAALREWSTPSSAIEFYAERLVRREGALALWDELILGGDYLAVVERGVVAASRRYNGTSRIDEATTLARAQGARDWLQEVNGTVQSLLEAESGPAAQRLAAILFRL